MLIFPRISGLLLLIGSSVSSFAAAPYTGTLEVEQIGTGNSAADVSLTLGAGTSASVVIHPANPISRADYPLSFSDISGDQVAQGVLITSIAENGRDNHDGSGPFYGTSAVWTYNSAYYIAVSRNANETECNINAAFGYFPYSDWVGGLATVSGASSSLQSSSSIQAGEFTDNSDGTFTLNSTSANSNVGILLAVSAANEDNFALSKAQADGSFTIYSHDNGVDAAVYEHDHVAFVYIPISRVGQDGLVALGRIKNGGDAVIGGGDYTIVKDTGSTGTWHLTIPGHSPNSGTLLISGEGGDPHNLDNAVSYEWDPDSKYWVIQSRDLPAFNPQNGQNNEEPMFSFAFFGTNQVTTFADSGAGSLRETISSARAGATISFAPSSSGQTIALDSEIAINTSLTIDASNLSGGLTFDGQGATRIFYLGSASAPVEPTSVTLHGLTLINGYASHGGAIYNRNNTLQITASTFSQNQAVYSGGGIYNIYGDLTLTASTLSQNQASSGGGIYNSDGDLTLTASTLWQNLASYSGGGIYNSDGVTLTASTLSQNQASYGGGIINFDGDLNLTASTLSQNQADSGGGIYNSEGNLSLTASIVGQNTASNAGPDIENDGGIVTSIDSNLIGDSSGSSLTAGQDGMIVDSDIKLAPLGNYGGPTQTMPPLYGSPAIDAGSNTDPGGTDQRELPRFVGGALDLGAVESNITLVDTAVDENNGTGDTSLREAIAAATAGSFIQFDPSVFTAANHTITLTGSEEIAIPSPVGLSIYARDLPSGVTIDANRNSRIFYFGSASAPAQPTSATLHGLTLINASAYDGGAIYNSYNTLQITASTLNQNQAGGSGGGIYNFSGDLTLAASTLSQNQADYGGGIYSYDGDLTLTASTLTQNQADQGGGIFNYSSDLSLTSSIVGQNTARDAGPDIRNSSGTVTSIGPNLIGDSSDSNIVGGDLIVNSDLKLAPLGNYGGPTQTMPPLYGSPAINAGGSTDPGGTDQRDLPRFVGGALDLGAVESNIILVDTAVDEDNGTGVTISLREAVAEATAGSFIQFDPSVFTAANHTITLTGSEIAIPSPVGLSIYARNLPSDVTIDAGGQSRIFNFGSTSAPAQPTSATLHGLTLINGYAASIGGAISNRNNTLQITASTLSQNQANHGGGIYNSNGDLSLTASTLSQNQAVTLGGGIFNDYGDLSLTSSTLSQNQATLGGGICSYGDLSLTSSIVGQNTASYASPDIANEDGSVTSIGPNLIGDSSGSSLTAGEDGIIVNSDIKLAPLGNYGGPTQTMPPLHSSPAIDAGGSTAPGGTDQRDLPRFVGGALDLGAVESNILLVTTRDDEVDSNSTLSLREAVAAASTGSFIQFDPSVFTAANHTITLTGSEIAISSPVGLSIYARNLPSGVTINADSQSRIFNFGSASAPAQPTSATLHGLTLINGFADNGGVIFNRFNTLQITASTLSQNQAEYGGGIYSKDGYLGLTSSTFSQNQADFAGGGIYSEEGVLSLTASTLNQNQADFGGGVYCEDGDLSLTASTLSENQADVFGGGIYNYKGDLSLTASIVGQNTASNAGPDIENNSGTVTSIGPNLIGDSSGSSLTAGQDGMIVDSDIKLAPLGNYGGPTQTMPPLHGSPAIDAGGSTDPGGSDQRDLPRFVGGALDLGAVESNITLVDTAVDENNGTGDTSLREAIAAASAGSFIQFDPSVFTAANHTITLTGSEIAIPSPVGLSIYARDLPSGVTIDANSQSRTFNFGSTSAPAQPTSATLHGLTLINGVADNGGAIFNANNTLQITASKLSQNQAEQRGGGIYCLFGELTLIASTLSQNQAKYDGGGIYSEAGHLSLTTSTLNQNQAAQSGGGIGSLFSYLSLTASTLSQNQAELGGGIGSFYGALSLTASTLSQNQAELGGGISYRDAHLTLTSSILGQNTASNAGPDIRNDSDSVTSIGSNLIGDSSGSSLTDGQDGIIVNSDIKLAPLANYGGPTQTMPPLHGSPAIDAGGSTHPGGSDQRELPRFVGGALDLGAVESNILMVTTRDDEVDSNSTLSLREAVAAATTGSFIQFDPSAFTAANHTITLTMGEFIIPSPVGLSIYARDLSSGVTIDADGKSRIFNFASSESAQPTSATLHGLSLINGYAANGGAIFNRYNTLQITASTLSQNQVSYRGGGIYNDYGALNLTASTLSQNQAGVNGGAIFNNRNTLQITASTLSQNQATFYGGGIYNFYGDLSLTSSIVGQNTASDAGPDIRNDLGTVTSYGPNLVGDSSSSDINDVGQDLIVNSEIKLAPLGDYGGPTQTMPPLPDSPALDAAGSTTLSMSDQRGFPRFLGSAIDLGAVESNIILVDTTTDEDGTGSSTSLREAIATANATPGSFVHFDANVFTEFNQRIALTHGEIAIPSPQGLIIYASDLPYGVTIDGQNSSRIFNIGSDTEPAQPTTAALYGLTLTNGYAQGATFPDDSGGAVYNHQNTLRIHTSTFSDNRANRGGGIFNHEGHLELTTSTLSQNLADIDGGGIYNFLADLDITASTISQNHAMAAIGGVYNNQSNLNLTSCIIGANTHQATPSPDIRIFSTSEVTATISVNGPNLISDDAFSGLPSENGITVKPNIHLAPLGDYGGPTQTMPPLPNSPATDAGGSSDLGFSEQRGFTRVVGAGLDLGAVEYQGASELPALVNATFELDSDSDGDANGLERALGTDAFSADPTHANKFRIMGMDEDGQLEFSFGYVDDSITLKLTRSIDLINFNTVILTSGEDFTDGGSLMKVDPNPPEGKAFYRLEAE